MVWGIHDQIPDFDIKEELEVEVKAESYKKLKDFEVLPI